MGMTTAKSPELIQHNETRAATETTTTGSSTYVITSTMQPMVEVTSTTEGSGEMTTLEERTGLYTEGSTTAVTPMSSTKLDLKEETQEPSFLGTSTPPTARTGLGQNATEEPLSETTFDGSGMSSSQTTEVLSTTLFPNKEATDLPLTTKVEDVTKLAAVDVTTARSPGLLVLNETTGTPPTDKMGTDYSTDITTEHPTVEVTLYGSTSEGSGTMTPSSGTTSSYTDLDSGETSTPSKSTDIKVTTEEPGFLSTSLIVETTGPETNGTEKLIFETATEGSGLQYSPTPSRYTTKGATTPLQTIETTSFETTIRTTEFPSTTTLQDETTPPGMGMTTAKSPELIQHNETRAATEATTTGSSTYVITSTMQPMVEGTSTTEGSGEMTTLEERTGSYAEGSTTAVTPMSSTKLDLKEETQEPNFLRTSTSPTARTGLGQNATEEPLSETTFDGSGMSSSQTTEVLSTTLFPNKEATDLPLRTKVEDVTKLAAVDVTTARSPGLIVLNETTGTAPIDKMGTDYSTDITTEHPTVEVTLYGSTSEGSGTMTPSIGTTTLYTDLDSGVTSMPSKSTDTKVTTEEPGFLSTSVIVEITDPETNATERPIFGTTKEGSGLSSPTTESLSSTSRFTAKEGTTLPTDKITSFDTTILTNEFSSTTALQDEATSRGMDMTTAKSPEQVDVKKTTEDPSYTNVRTEMQDSEQTATQALLFETTMEGSGMAPSPTIDNLSTTFTIEKESTPIPAGYTTYGITSSIPMEIHTTPSTITTVEGSKISPSTTIDEDISKSPMEDVATPRAPGLIKLNDTTSTASIEKMVTGYSTEQTAETKVLVTDVTSIGTASEGSGTVTTSSGITTADNQESVTAVTPSSPKQTELKKTTEEPSYLRTTVIGETTGPDNTAKEEELFQTTMEGSGMSPSPTIEILSTTITIEEEATMSMSITIGQDISTSPMEDVATPRAPGLIKLNDTTSTASIEKMVTGYSTEQTAETKVLVTDVTSIGTASEGSGTVTTSSGITTADNQESVTAVTPSSPKQTELRKTTEEPSYLRTTVIGETTGPDNTAKEEELFQTTMEGSGMSPSPTIEILSTTITIEEEATISMSTTIGQDILTSPMEDVATPRAPGLIKLNDTTSTASIEKMVTGYSTEQTAETKVLVTDVTSIGTASEGSGTVTTSSGITTADNQESVTAVTPSSPKQTELKKTTEEPSYLRTTVIGETTGPDNTAKEEELFQTTMEGSGMSPSPTIEILSTSDHY